MSSQPKRTAATSALAARFLARPDARTLLVLGTGRIARDLARCHAAARPRLERVLERFRFDTFERVLAERGDLDS